MVLMTFILAVVNYSLITQKAFLLRFSKNYEATASDFLKKLTNVSYNYLVCHVSICPEILFFSETCFSVWLRNLSM